jgi:hypothetical protein
LQVVTALFTQEAWPGWHTAAWQVPARQSWPLGQSVDARQLTHEPLVRSQSIPSGTHVLSEAHFVRQTLPTHVLVASRQSASVRQSTQRWVPVLQTCAAGQASELVQVVYGTHFRSTQSLLGGQSLLPAQSTHWKIEGSQTLLSVQSRLLLHDGTAGLPPLPPPSFLEPDALFELHPACARTRTANPKANHERATYCLRKIKKRLHGCIGGAECPPPANSTEERAAAKTLIDGSVRSDQCSSR